MRHLATSTIALTLYNLLATGSGARDILEIGQGVEGWARVSRIDLAEGQVLAALEELVRRGYVHELKVNGRFLYDVKDPQRRQVIERDRSDDGSEDAGWRGWRVYARPAAAPPTVALDEVAK